MGIRGVAVAVLVLHAGVSGAESPRIGFLANVRSSEEMDPHNRTAWETAATLGSATLLSRQADGAFSNSSGQRRPRGAFDVVWYHQGDTAQRNGMHYGATSAIGAIRPAWFRSRKHIRR
jgi:hypothetical protein